MALYRPSTKTTPVEKASTLDIAWLAGIYEGEGCVGFSAAKKPRCFKLQITQKEPWILERIRAKFGGGVCRKRDGIHEWKSFSARGIGIALTIFGLLSPHRQGQILAALKEI